MAVSITISVDQNSQNIANNTTNVTVTVRASWTGGSYNSLQKSGWLKIDGTQYNFTSSFNSGQSNSGTQTLFSKTVNVTHNSDGKKTLAVSASYTSGVSSGTVGASASVELTTIPRKSSLSASNGTLGTSLTLTVTKQASSFTHTITYKCGTATGTICSKSSSTSVAWNTSNGNTLSLASQNTTGTSVSVTFTITTYSGSTSVGSNTKTVSMSIPSSVKPSCSVSVTDPTGVSDIYGGFVSGLSKFKVVVTPTTSYGSGINSYKTTANGTTYTTATFTTGVLSASGTLKVSATVTDKRGRTGSDTESITVIPYSKPAISRLSVGRCNQNGTANEQGECVKVTFSASVSSVNNQNTASYVLKYKRSTDDSYTEIALAEYDGSYSVNEGSYIFVADTGSTYNIELDVSDRHVTIARATTASTSFVLMHFNTAGDGMGIGKIAELNGVLDIGMQTRFYGGILHPVLAPETDLNDIRTPNTYVGENASTYKYGNCPIKSGTFTLEVTGAGAEGQVKQSIQTCSKAQSKTYERYYYSSSWGEWVCTSDYDGALLWEGALFMHGTQTITLTEAISKQRSGIALVFSEYVDGAAKNQSFHIRYIPKIVIEKHSGSAQCIQMSTSNLAFFATKYLYINDTQIIGHDNNDNVGTGTCGITYTNNRFVLRYVIGV